MDSKNKTKPSQYKNSSYIEAVSHALDGIKVLLKEEANLRFHFIVAILVVLLGFYVHLSRMDWLFLVLALILVIVMECLNSMVERLTDLVVNDCYHPLAKIVKDVAAGVVLLTCIGVAVIGVLLFTPYIFK